MYEAIIFSLAEQTRQTFLQRLEFLHIHIPTWGMIRSSPKNTAAAAWSCRMGMLASQLVLFVQTSSSPFCCLCVYYSISGNTGQPIFQ
jgi:hypothetical protein